MKPSAPAPRAAREDVGVMQEPIEQGRHGGGIAKKARLELEAKTGKKVVSGESYLPPSKRKGIEK